MRDNFYYMKVKTNLELLKSYGKFLKFDSNSKYNREGYKVNISSVDKVIEYLKNGYNLGFSCSSRYIIIDIDTREEGDEADINFRRLKHDYGIEIDPHVRTTRGGYHCYARLSNGFTNTRIRNKLEGYEGIEFKQFATCPPSVVDGSPYYYIDNDMERSDMIREDIFSEELGFELSEKLQKKEPKSREVTRDEIDKGWEWRDREIVVRYLSNISADVGYHDWFELLGWFHNWEDDAGLAIFDKWSSSSSKYKEGEVKSKWDSLDKGYRKNSTLELILYLAKKAGYILELSDKLEIVRDVLLKYWVRYETGENCYYNINRDLERSESNFNGTLAPSLRLLKIRINDGKQSRTSMSSLLSWQIDLIKLISITDYDPSNTRKLSYLDDNCYILNKFNNNLVIKGKVITEAGSKFINKLRNHIALMIGSKNSEHLILESWLAYQIQKRGQRLQWLPLIIGKPGIGKSTIGNILRVLLGNDNVRIVTKNDLVSNFNEWAGYSCVSVLEEFSLTSTDYDSTMLILKSYITDEQVTINGKFKGKQTITNRTNYIAFSNDNKPLQIEDGDRRFWIVKCELDSKELVKRAMHSSTVSPNDYFNSLYEGLEKHKGELMTWLENYKINTSLLKVGVAPRSDAKDRLNLERKLTIYGYSETLDIIESKVNPYITSTFIVPSELEASLSRVGISLGPRSKGKLMNELGYITALKRVLYNGKYIYLCYKGEGLLDYEKLQKEKRL